MRDLWLLPFSALVAARGRLFHWVPVAIGCGIGLWFSCENEPGLLAYGAAGLLLALALWARRVDWAYAPAWALACGALGFLAAGLRVLVVAAPVLAAPYYGPVTGRIVDIDKSQSDAPRLTLDHIWLDGVPPDETPIRLRISLHGDQPWADPAPGQVVMITARLAPPDGPVDPGGFDFRRMAWFQGLGAVGYSRNPLVKWADAGGMEQWIARARRSLSGAVQRALPGDAGAFAAGVMTGDRSGLSLAAVQDLRDSSLAHLLAISGMNLAFLIGFTFAGLRGGLALVAPLALRVNTKKLAAAVSLPIAAFYLALSGANLATARAFVMVAVMLGAVLFDRRALTLRSVAIAATLLLLIQPESLLDPGFQMSFAATVALIVGFRAMDAALAARGWLARQGGTLVLSSLIGGMATAPYAAAHFNRFADYGFVANLLTVPVMGAVVMPAGAMAALLAPLGLARPALWVMEQGSAWILYVAAAAAARHGAVTGIVEAGAGVLPLLTLGLLALVLGPWRLLRWAGAVALAVALLHWQATARPLLLIAPDAELAGLMGPDGRALSKPKGQGFAAKSWLENDGDLVDQATAATRPGFVTTAAGQSFAIGPLRGLIAKRGTAADLCRDYDLVIGPITGAAPAGCQIITPDLMAQTGALALFPQRDGFEWRMANAGHRLWSGPDRGDGGQLSAW